MKMTPKERRKLERAQLTSKYKDLFRPQNKKTDAFDLPALKLTSSTTNQTT